MFGDFEALLDLIYEAAVLPELWPQVLLQLSTAIGGAGGLLFVSAAGNTQGLTTSPDIADLFEEFVRDGWADLNQRPARLLKLGHPGFISDLDVFTQDELDADPVYQNFFRKRGLGWAAGTGIQTITGDTILISIEKAYDKGPISRNEIAFFDRLRPHLARSTFLSSRAGLQRLEAVTAAFEQLGLPAAAVNQRGGLLTANSSFNALVGPLFVDTASHVGLRNREADKLLREALAGSDLRAGKVRSIPFRADEGERPGILHVVPVRGRAQDVFSRSVALLIVSTLDRAVAPNAELLNDLFDLTPQEARVAQAIARGRSIEDVAVSSGLTRETVRTYLKNVFRKTGVRRQAELSSLLTGAILPKV